MRCLIFDTDILSTFGKIRRFDLLWKLLPCEKFFIPTSAYNELFKAKDWVMSSLIILWSVMFLK